MKHKKNHWYSVTMGALIIIALVLMAVPLAVIIFSTYITKG